MFRPGGASQGSMQRRTPRKPKSDNSDNWAQKHKHNKGVIKSSTLCFNIIFNIIFLFLSHKCLVNQIPCDRAGIVWKI